MARLRIHRGFSSSTGIGCTFGFVFLVIVGLLLGTAIQSARQAASANSCNCHLKQLGIALQNYHDTYKVFPPAYLADADGKPMHSWRVLLLPFLEEQELCKRYRFDEPWDSPHNRQLADEISVTQFRCPAATGPANETSYVVVSDPETLFPGDRGRSIRDVRDGTSKTISIVEVANSGIHWMEPRDLTLDEALAGINPPNRSPAISSHHVGGAMVGWGDAHVSYLPNDLSIEKLRALLTASGGEKVSEPSN